MHGAGIEPQASAGRPLRQRDDHQLDPWIYLGGRYLGTL